MEAFQKSKPFNVAQDSKRLEYRYTYLKVSPRRVVGISEHILSTYILLHQDKVLAQK